MGPLSIFIINVRELCGLRETRCETMYIKYRGYKNANKNLLS